MYYGERFNSISHLVGAGLALAGSALLIVLAARLGDPWKIVSFSIYGAMLVALYAFSTLYHSVRGRAKDVLRKFDHCSIYLLIAGSYTPFALVSLRGAWGWSLLGTVWGLGLFGILQEIWFAKGARVLSLVIYVLMGWLALVAVEPLWQALTPAGFAWLVAGGIFYTVGIIFYATDHKVRHGHGLWHLFVLAGSICHFFTVLLYVA
ncbi:hemolysin III family protein [Polaromonas sp.]|uniref:PAQR family membrane homeostasis protein TrhA n=1 Tax=Polaromonas sp. TaxID=1869339 RepID=UPI00182CD238|nr:hemolysin III family protein [Polaromonas sp.]NMM07817.1 hemolysin III family protein [Polaromonas sp.]